MHLTYSLLSLPLVGLDFHLEFIHQILQSQHILPVLLTLQMNIGMSLKKGGSAVLGPSQSGGAHMFCPIPSFEWYLYLGEVIFPPT